MINKLIKIPYSSTLMDSSMNPEKFHHVVEDDTLLILHESALNTKTAYTSQSLSFQYKFADDFVMASLSLISSSDISSEDFDRKYMEAFFVVKNKGSIPGYEVLNISTMQKLWISQYDLDFILSGDFDSEAS